MDIYYESVGRNSLLLLNLSPDKRGLVHPIDSARLLEWKRQLDLDFSKNLVGKKCRFSSGEPKNLKFAFDSDFGTYWQAKGTTGTLEIDFGKEIACNRLLLQEYIPEGQKVKKFAVDIWKDGNWTELTQATTIGYKRILRFLTVKTQKLRVRIEDSLAPPMISTVAVYNAPVLMAQPEIRRDQSGKITILSPDKIGEIYYTTDGTEPTRNSSRYGLPFLLDGSVTIRAVIYNGTENQGETTTQKFSGSKSGWKVVGETKTNPALFDGNPGSTWTSKKGVKNIEIDLGAANSFQGISYMPDQSRGNYGIALNYIVSVSNDGINWEPTAKGEFSNIRNNPIRQTIRFEKPVQARFLKLGTTSISDGHPSLGIAELELLTE
jgi:alpha-L-fucosidase